MKIALVCMLVAVAPAMAQSYPAKPIRLLSTLGGGAEGLHRATMQKAAEALGQPIVMETQSAANGMVAGEMTARAAPDGYTLLLAVPGSMVVRGFLTRVMPYQPVKDFSPITLAAYSVSAITAHPDYSLKTLKELIETSRIGTRKATFATNGIGASDHLAGELINQMTGAGLLHVPHKVQTQAVTAVLGREVDTYFGVLAGTGTLVASGKLKALAYVNVRPPVGADASVPVVRDVVPGFESPPYWQGYFGPAGMPQPVLRRLNSEFVKALIAPDIRPKFEALNNQVVANSPEEFTAMLYADLERVGRIVKAAGIKPE